MSFGRRLALFFVLIAILPTLALVGVLLIVNEDSRQGKADARLAAGLETALAIYQERTADAAEPASRLAADPELAAGLERGDAAALARFADRAARTPGVEAVEVRGPGETELAEAGASDAVAFARARLTSGGKRSGTLLVSTTTASQYGAQVRRLTKRELVVSRDGDPLAATVDPPNVELAPGETADLEVPEGEFRAHQLSLDSDQAETLLLLGPRKEGRLVNAEEPVVVLLIGFLLLGLIFAYALARTLTGLHMQVAEQAVTDELTGLDNRRRMQQRLADEGARAQRFGHEISAVIIDIDDFKQINDERGHQQGDVVLRTIADIVRSTTRAIDITARFGGDELALVLLETDAEGARVLAERLRQRVSEKEIKLRNGESIHVTVSIGAATVPDSAASVDDLIEAADQALLTVKRSGKDQVASAPKLKKRKARAR